ncbi:MAG: hypothetical protein HUJ56_10995 [Erysipelotrichaceae bacterium]|nr:hypothetical protein [Erysipelotrichaceae bacterium]
MQQNVKFDLKFDFNKILKTSKLILLIGCIVAVILYYFIFLPPINVFSLNSLIFILIILTAILFLLILKISKDSSTLENKLGLMIKGYGILFILLLVGSFLFSPVLNSKLYANRITVTSSSFTDDIKEVDLTNLPLLDKISTQNVGDRVMGQLPELISQFEVSSLYTQINYQGRLVRVTPLEYNGFIKWFNNKSSGAPGYIIVDSTTGEATLKRLETGMKYMPSAYLFDNLYRHLRLQYPFSLFGECNFEIDDKGKPYWITQVLSMKYIDTLTDVKGIIMTDPISGASTYLDASEVPSWVDHVYSANLIINQADDWGKYQDGYFNTLFGQKNVKQTTDGYTYLTQGDDVCIYTGITSVLADEANIGFILSNLRTKETKFYAIPGAEEYSAMASAEGAIQEKGYVSTFPLLINLNNRPTYLVSLKDGAGLVKSYAFIDVTNYQKVKVSDADNGLAAAATAYLQMMGSNKIIAEGEEVSGTISDIASVVVDGYTYYYIKIDHKKEVYEAIVTLNSNLPFLQVGDKITFTHNEETVTSIK